VRLTKTFLIVATHVASAGVSGCGRTDLGRSPSQVVVDVLEGASGAAENEFQQTLRSDVLTEGSIFNDLGRVQMRIVLRDQGTATASATSAPMAGTPQASTCPTASIPR
jgi:hypothetical protein